MSQTNDFDTVSVAFIKLQKEKKELKAKLEALTKELAPIEEKMIFYLKEMDASSIKRSEGTIILTERLSYSMPKDMNDKLLVLKHFESKGKEVYYDYVTINHAKLNTFIDQEMEFAAQRGDTDFSIPGLGKPTVTEYVTLRKG